MRLLTAFKVTTILGLTVGVAHAQSDEPLSGSESNAQQVQKDFAPELKAEETASPAPQGWKLPQPELLKKRGIDLGGWIEQGITYNAMNPNERRRELARRPWPVTRPRHMRSFRVSRVRPADSRSSRPCSPP
jgi:hypothetical protein